MPLEDLVGTDKFISDLVKTNPEDGDPKREGDDHMRGIKNVLVNTLAGSDGSGFDEAITVDPADINAAVAAYLAGGGGLQIGDTKTTANPAAFDGPDWLEMNGQAINRTTYATLFAQIGTTYGAGDGATTFNLPDARGAALQGEDASGSFAPDGSPELQGHAPVGVTNKLLLAVESGLPSHAHVQQTKIFGGQRAEDRGDGYEIHNTGSTTSTNVSGGTSAAQAFDNRGRRCILRHLIKVL